MIARKYPYSGEIRLTWPQAVWGITILVGLVAGWYDLRTKVELLRETQITNTKRISEIENSLRRSAFTSLDAEEFKQDIIKEIRRTKQ